MGAITRRGLSGVRTACTDQIRRVAAGQALIDQGMLSGAEPYLRELIQDPEASVAEQAEAHGLMGRIYKQRYVDEAGKASPERGQRNLQRSFDEYQFCYAADPKANTWHGINMVALLARAEKDKIALKGATDGRALARTILAIALDQHGRRPIVVDCTPGILPPGWKPVWLLGSLTRQSGLRISMSSKTEPTTLKSPARFGS